MIYLPNNTIWANIQIVTHNFYVQQIPTGEEEVLVNNQSHHMKTKEIKNLNIFSLNVNLILKDRKNKDHIQSSQIIKVRSMERNTVDQL